VRVKKVPIEADQPTASEKKAMAEKALEKRKRDAQLAAESTEIPTPGPAGGVSRHTQKYRRKGDERTWEGQRAADQTPLLLSENQNSEKQKLGPSIRLRLRLYHESLLVQIFVLARPFTTNIYLGTPRGRAHFHCGRARYLP